MKRLNKAIADHRARLASHMHACGMPWQAAWEPCFGEAMRIFCLRLVIGYDLEISSCTVLLLLTVIPRESSCNPRARQVVDQARLTSNSSKSGSADLSAPTIALHDE